MVSKGTISNKSFSCFGGLSFHAIQKIVILTEETEAVPFFLLTGQAMPHLLEGH